jgi:spore germination protein
MNNDNYEKYENQDKEKLDKAQEKDNLGLKITVALMSLVIIALIVSLAIIGGGRGASDDKLLDANFQKSYFDLVAETNDLSVKMDKLAASNSVVQQRQLLYEIWKNAELAEMSMSSLNSQDTGVNNLQKFMNQLGDYCHYLAQETEGGKPLSAENEKMLKKLSDILREVNNSLAQIQSGLESGSLSVSDTEKLSASINEIVVKFNEASVEYPQMIYDGPFTDALTDKETKGLTGDDIDEAAGRETVERLLGGEKINDVRFDGESTAEIHTLNFTAFTDGGEVTVQLSKKGGRLILLERNADFSEPKLSVDKCLELAQDFLLNAGYDNMTSVWVSNIDGVFYINFAPVQDDVILYPDLIKVKVASDSGAVTGVDAKNYAFNHTERDLPTPSLSLSTAKSKLKNSLNANEGRLALIPYRSTQEKLTYEFACEGDNLYFVYIDAQTGDELNILIVIDSQNGTLLM